MLSNYKHISFDLDGTLIHTLPEYRQKIVPSVISELQGVINDQRHIDKFWFETNRDQTIKKCFNIDPELFWELFRKLDTEEKRSEHTVAYHDVEETLKKLKQMGKIISIVTGAPQKIAEIEIAKINPDCYDFIFSVRDSEYNEKPAPESLHFVLNKLAMQPQETIYIGNGDEDCYFAKNAGVDFIRIDRGEYDYDFGDGPIKTIKSLNELF